MRTLARLCSLRKRPGVAMTTHRFPVRSLRTEPLPTCTDDAPPASSDTSTYTPVAAPDPRTEPAISEAERTAHARRIDEVMGRFSKKHGYRPVERARAVTTVILANLVDAWRGTNSLTTTTANLAEKVGVDVSMVRRWIYGDKAVPLWAVLMLPPSDALMVLDAMRVEVLRVESEVLSEASQAIVDAIARRLLEDLSDEDRESLERTRDRLNRGRSGQ